MAIDAELRSRAFACLQADDPAEKCRLTHALRAERIAGDVALDASRAIGMPPQPGRPARPALVPVKGLPQRGLGTPQGKAAFLHAVAHIEFNAINLAWDAVVRFPGMPDAYYDDWARVADDEARHFDMLQRRLGELGHGYGDFDAHDALWQMAERTSHACLDRMALVPRVLEARGLDVTPAMIERLRSVGDAQSAAILGVILDEEVEHVAIGTRWFRWCCEQAGVDPHRTFAELVERHAAGILRAPFNRDARSRAGFDPHELDWIDRAAAR